MAQAKVVLITGAGSGVGQVTATHLAQQGYRVWGTTRDGRGPAGAPYITLQLELASDDSVRRCVQQVLDQAGRIDVLFNNAGFGVVGGVEETRLEQAQAQMEVFLFGIHRMVKAVLPHMRAQGGGQIINMSSSAATLALPFVGLYSAGKYAMAGFSEALRREVQSFNIKVSYLEATALRTEAADEIMVAADRVEAYSPLRDRAIRDFQNAIRHGKDPIVVAKAVQQLIETEHPRLVYRIDSQAKLLTLLKGVTPQRAWDALFGMYGRARGGTAGNR
jgi:NAD(P)-dependent dehydrogenase (short-subunit alcohol dehydrogenase family)